MTLLGMNLDLEIRSDKKGVFLAKKSTSKLYIIWAFKLALVSNMVFAIACQKESQPAQGESKTHRDFEKTSTTIDKKNFELFELELTQVGCSLKPLGLVQDLNTKVELNCSVELDPNKLEFRKNKLIRYAIGAKKLVVEIDEVQKSIVSEKLRLVEEQLRYIDEIYPLRKEIFERQKIMEGFSPVEKANYSLEFYVKKLNRIKNTILAEIGRSQLENLCNECTSAHLILLKSYMATRKEIDLLITDAGDQYFESDVYQKNVLAASEEINKNHQEFGQLVVNGWRALLLSSLTHVKNVQEEIDNQMLKQNIKFQKDDAGLWSMSFLKDYRSLDRLEVEELNQFKKLVGIWMTDLGQLFEYCQSLNLMQKSSELKQKIEALAGLTDEIENKIYEKNGTIKTVWNQVTEWGRF